MEINQILNYMSDYGLIFIAIIIFLEYLNLPGFPAGIILPLAGVWVSTADINLFSALIVSVLSALVASWILYLVGWFGGDFFLNKYISKFPSQKESIEKQLTYLRKKGNIGVFVSKLIPMVRTLISIPAGVLKLNFFEYSVYSALGISIWNGVLMLSGYILGQEFITQFLTSV